MKRSARRSYKRFEYRVSGRVTSSPGGPFEETVHANSEDQAKRFIKFRICHRLNLDASRAYVDFHSVKQIADHGPLPAHAGTAAHFH